MCIFKRKPVRSPFIEKSMVKLTDNVNIDIFFSSSEPF